MRQIYLRNNVQRSTGKGGYAIGYEPIRELPDGTVEVAVSFACCSDEDAFNRKMARTILQGRLRKGLADMKPITGKFDILTLLGRDSDQSFAEQLKEMYAA
jgi:hypothetical protein